ncbi:MAG: hypothetical protein JWM47_229 [Acidimicrobiales bacterium]|nr:hypothetical protein [Acidimicrobiales bacterium]
MPAALERDRERAFREPTSGELSHPVGSQPQMRWKKNPGPDRGGCPVQPVGGGRNGASAAGMATANQASVSTEPPSVKVRPRVMPWNQTA